MNILPRRSLRLSPRLHEPDWWLIAIVLTLTMFGTVMIYSSTAGMAASPGGVGNAYLFRQLIFAVIGIIAMYVMMHIDYHRWRDFAMAAIGGVVLLLILVLVVGQEVNGARSWFDLGPIQLQPSELAKPAIILYLASWLCSKGARIKHVSHGMLQFVLVIGFMVVLLFLQPDMGTAVVLATVGAGMFFVAGPTKAQFFALVLATAGAFILLALSAEYRRERILAFLDPEASIDGTGWHLMQARFALGDGGLFGVGLGASRQKFTWLPEPHNDAIFAVIGEELGLVGASFVLLLFGLLGYRGYRIARCAPDQFGMLLGVGVTTWLIFQGVFNIGGVTSALPFTGITLPLISYGGSSLIVTLASVGLLLNISRQTDEYPTAVPQLHDTATHSAPAVMAAGFRQSVGNADPATNQTAPLPNLDTGWETDKVRSP